MQVLAFELQLRGQRPPVLHAVLLRDPLAAATQPTVSDITVIEAFEMSFDSDDWGVLCTSFAEHAAARVSTLDPDRVIVRRADNSPTGSRANGPKMRLLIDGAVTAAASLQVRDTMLLMGDECASRYGKTKAAMEADGQSLAGKAYAGAAAAALAGISHDRV